MDRQYIVGQRKFLAGSRIEGHQNDKAGPQRRHVGTVPAARQSADECLTRYGHHFNENLPLTGDRAHGTDADSTTFGIRVPPERETLDGRQQCPELVHATRICVPAGYRTQLFGCRYLPKAPILC